MMTLQEFNKRYIYNVRTDRIGGGTFGTVYKAYDTVLDREVAIKIAEVKYSGSVELSLRREYDSIKDLPEHPYIARYEGVYTFETLSGLIDCAVLQYYPDGDLSHLMAQVRLSQAEREALMLKLLEGLNFLHSNRVVHRDLKPANILIHRRYIQGREEYIPKVADFGLSKLASPNEQSYFENSFLGGTLRYSSPEQLESHEIRFNTDLWSWAVIAYEVLTGQSLFDVSNISSSVREACLMEQILRADFAPALTLLPPKWQQVISLCLVRDSQRRVSDAASLLKFFTAYPTPTINDSTQVDQDMSSRFPVLMKWGGGAVGLMLVLFLSFVVWQSPPVSSSLEYMHDAEDSISMDEVKCLEVSRLSVDRSGKSEYGKNIEFKADLLLFPSIKNSRVQDYLYKELDLELDSSGGDSDEVDVFVNKLGDQFIQSNLDHDGYGTSQTWNMKLGFVNQHFLCVEVLSVYDIGSGTGAGVWPRTYYKNLNYKTGEIVKLSDIVDPIFLTKELLYRCFGSYARDDSDRNVSTEVISGDLDYPEEFTFDEEAITFCFPKNSIGAGYLGEIRVKLPYWEIEEGLKSEFKRMISASQSIEVKYK